MKQAISKNQFHDAFNSIRPDNFSYEGLNALYNWLEEQEEDAGEQYELDVIALCCEFTESTLEDAICCYDIETLEDLQDNTLVIEVDSETIIYMNW